jgi:hypothetical protein
MNRHRLPAILLLITYLSACHTWRAETVTPQALIETSPPNQIRVVRADGTKQVLSHALVRADTMWGVSPEPAIPLTDVQTIETLHRDVGKSFLLAGAFTAGFLLLGAAVCSNSCGGGLQN